MEEMRQPTFLILAALAGGKMHGYGLITEATDLSEGRVRLKVGTLYAALDRLSSAGLVTSAGEEIVEGRLRRYYELTAAGAEALEQEARRLQAQSTKAIARLASRTIGFAS